MKKPRLSARLLRTPNGQKLQPIEWTICLKNSQVTCFQRLLILWSIGSIEWFSLKQLWKGFRLFHKGVVVIQSRFLQSHRDNILSLFPLIYLYKELIRNQRKAIRSKIGKPVCDWNLLWPGDACAKIIWNLINNFITKRELVQISINKLKTWKEKL